MFPDELNKNNNQFTVLQISACFFILPAISSWKRGLYLGFFVYFSNFLISFYVHRGRRTKTNDMIDTLDNTFVFIWVLYNLIHYIKFLDFTNQNINLATVSVLLVFMTKIWTKLLPWRTGKRYLIHFMMHFFGATGSYFLLNNYSIIK